MFSNSTLMYNYKATYYYSLIVPNISVLILFPQVQNQKETRI